jgi:hypothetical protein
MRGEVSSGARVEDPAAAGMELPAASGPGSGARRESLSFNVDTGLARFMYGTRTADELFTSRMTAESSADSIKTFKLRAWLEMFYTMNWLRVWVTSPVLDEIRNLRPKDSCLTCRHDWSIAHGYPRLARFA